jgi:ACS family glucarate transporter-like MFS transporter
MPPEPGKTALDPTRVALIALMFGFSMVSYFERTIISIAGPELMKAFNLSPTQMGSIYSAFILGYALLMIPGGYVTDRLGGRLTLALMGGLSAVFTALIVLSGRPGLGTYIGIVPALFLMRLGLGAVTAPLYPACARITANWIPVVHHARVQGLIIAGSSLGAALSPVLFAWMLIHFKWRASFLMAAGISVLLGAAWYAYARDLPPKDTAFPPLVGVLPGRAAWMNLFTNRNLMLLTFAYGALGYFQYIFFYWTYYYFGEVLHLGSHSSARYTTILFLIEGAIMPLGGLLSDRLTRSYGAQFGRRIVPIAGLALSAVFTYVGTISSAIAMVVLCLSLSFGLASFCEGPFWAAVTEMADDQVGAASSILNTGAQIAGMFAPVLTPYIASRAGWSWGLYAGNLIALSGVVAIYFVDVRPLK